MTTQRVYLPDVRGNDKYLRATWHPDTQAVVLSHWVDDVCVASTPVGVAELSTLIGLLVGALQDSATRPVVVPPVPPTSWTSTTLGRIRQRFQPKLAQVIALRRPSRDQTDTVEHNR